MWKKINPYTLNDTEEEDRALSAWALDSHCWVEFIPGSYECKWCKKILSSGSAIDTNYPLCTNNKIIKKLIGEI